MFIAYSSVLRVMFLRAADRREGRGRGEGEGGGGGGEGEEIGEGGGGEGGEGGGGKGRRSDAAVAGGGGAGGGQAQAVAPLPGPLGTEGLHPQQPDPRLADEALEEERALQRVQRQVEGAEGARSGARRRTGRGGEGHDPRGAHHDGYLSKREER